MSRKTFKIIISVTGIAIFLAILIPRLIDQFSQSDQEETIIGYSSGTAVAIVEEIIEQGEVTLGEVTQPYQRLQIKITDGEYAGETFEIEYGNRQIRHDMILLDVGDRLMVTISSMPDGSTIAHFTDYYRRNSLLLLSGIFVLGSVIISGWKGVKSLIGI